MERLSFDSAQGREIEKSTLTPGPFFAIIIIMRCGIVKIVAFLVFVVVVEAIYLWYSGQVFVSIKDDAYGFRVSVNKKAWKAIYRDLIGRGKGVYFPGKGIYFKPRTIKFTIVDKPQIYGRMIDPQSRKVLKSFYVSYGGYPDEVRVKMHINRKLLYEDGRLRRNANKVIANFITEILFYLSYEDKEFYTTEQYKRFLNYTEKKSRIINSLVHLE